MGRLLLDCPVPHILTRAWTTKNKKSEIIPLIFELSSALTHHKRTHATSADKVFAQGVPRARTLRLDLAHAHIPYRDA